MFEGCCLNTLESSPCQKLSEPFMLEKFWLWERDDRVADIIEAEMENKVCRGNMELINLGCGMSYRLIITGNCRGRSGILRMWASSPAVSGRIFRMV